MGWQTLRNVMIGVAFGVVIGIGGFTFIYAQGYAYLTNDPRACANCHVMREQGRSDQELAQARDFQRRAQFFLDFVEAENSTGFHADQEAVRILGESVNFSRLGQLSLRGGIPPRPAGPPPAPVATPSH